MERLAGAILDLASSVSGHQPKLLARFPAGIRNVGFRGRTFAEMAPLMRGDLTGRWVIRAPKTETLFISQAVRCQVRRR